MIVIARRLCLTLSQEPYILINEPHSCGFVKDFCIIVIAHSKHSSNLILPSQNSPVFALYQMSPFRADEHYDHHSDSALETSHGVAIVSGRPECSGLFCKKDPQQQGSWLFSKTCLKIWGASSSWLTHVPHDKPVQLCNTRSFSRQGSWLFSKKGLKI